MIRRLPSIRTYSFLVMLNRLGPMDAREICKRYLSDAGIFPNNSTTQSTLYDLHRQGLVDREINKEDRMADVYSITDKGYQLTVDAREAFRSLAEYAPC